jgi:hypothetical protein
MIIRSTAAALTALAVMGASAAEARDRVFGGSTRAPEPIVVQATERGDKLKSAVVAWEARCGDGRIFYDAGRTVVERSAAGFEQPAPNALTMSRNARGRFSGRQSAARELNDEQIAVFTMTLTGSLGRTAASGTLTAEARIVRRADGAVVDTCRTGAVRWAASRRPGVIFGGTTSQQEPVVLRLNATRRRVADLLFGWGSVQCEPPGFFRLGDSLRNFPLRAGRFGDAFEQRFPGEGGAERRFAYDLRGSVTRTLARGTFSVQVTDTGADGARATCRSGNVTWRAATG